MNTISAIVPVYNEEKTIGYVLKTLVESKVFCEVICVNDGSADSSVVEIKKHKKVEFINCKINRGKGNALSLGIKKAKGDFVALIDADLSKLNDEHIKKMVAPIINESGVDVVIAYEDGEFLSLFSGSRIYKRAELLPLLKTMKTSKFGVEVLLNLAFNNRTVKYIQLHNLGHLEKIQKYETKFAVVSFLKQWFVDVLKQYLKSGITYAQFKKALDELPKYISNKSKKYNMRSKS